VVAERDAEGVLLAAVQLAYDAEGFPRQRLVLPVPPVPPVPAAALTVDVDNRVTSVHGVAVTHNSRMRFFVTRCSLRSVPDRRFPRYTPAGVTSPLSLPSNLSRPYCR
jgi:hypothetical protein